MMVIRLVDLIRVLCKYRIPALLFFLNLCIISVEAQVEINPQKEDLPLGSSIRYGQLDNGFTYFIKPFSEEIEPKLFLRLYNKAGSNQEDDDQLNMAHAVEHLAFKATKNYPAGVDNHKGLERLGVGSSNLLAFSGRKYTEYWFNAPHGNEEALDLGLLWFRDISTGLKLKEAEIDQVRKELRQEFLDAVGDDLNGHSAVSRMYSELVPCVQDEADFLEHHEQFDPVVLRRFYRNWYRPDLLALSVVGNIKDLDEVERKIRDTFSGILPTPYPVEKKNCDSLYLNGPPRFVKIEREKDPSKYIEDMATKIHMIFRDSRSGSINWKQSLQRAVLLQILIDVINDRLKEGTGEYQSHDVLVFNLFENKEMPSGMEITLSTEPGEEKIAIKKTMAIVRQLQQHGVTKPEWKRNKEKRLYFMKHMNEKDPNYWIEGISRYYNHGEAFPNEKNVHLQDWMSSLSLSELNQFTSVFLKEPPKDVGIIAPAGSRALSYEEKKIRSWIEDDWKRQVGPYKIPEVISGLMSLKEVRNLQEVNFFDKGMGESGANEIVLDNDLMVVLKKLETPTDTKKIKIHGFSRKGASSFADEKFSSAINAPAIVKNSGVNGMDKSQLNPFLSTTSILPGSISPYIDYQESGIHAAAAVEDLETALQLIYLYFTRPNKDKTAFEDWRKEERKSYLNPPYNLINKDFHNAIRSLTGDKLVGGSLGKRSPSGTKRFKSINSTEIDVAYEVYEEIFGNARDFTFLISGDFKPELVIPLVQKYLGNLPNLDNPKKSPSIQEAAGMPKGPLYFAIPSEGNYRIENINYATKFVQEVQDQGNWKETIKVEALGEVIRHKLWALRFEKGYGLYGVYAAGRFNRDMDRYEIATSLECHPEEFSTIRDEIKDIFSQTKSGSISSEELQEGLKRMYSLYDAEKAKLPQVMNKRLYHYYRYDQPWLDPVEVEQFLKSISLEDIVEVAQKYCTDENLYEFVMMEKPIEEQ